MRGGYRDVFAVEYFVAAIFFLNLRADEAELWSYVELVERILAQLFFLRLHDVGKCGITWSIEALLGGNIGREFEGEGLAAFIDIVLAGECGAFEFEGANPSDLWPV